MTFNLSARPRYFAAVFYSMLVIGWILSWRHPAVAGSSLHALKGMLAALSLVLAVGLSWPGRSAPRAAAAALLSVVIAGLAGWWLSFEHFLFYAALSALVLWNWRWPEARMSLWPPR